MKPKKHFPDNFDNADIMPLINERVYKAKDLGVSSRTIYHWKNEGLLFELYNEEDKNLMLRFSLVEYFWVRVIQTCRDYGMSIKDIKLLKNKIIDNIHGYDNQIQIKKKQEQLIMSIRETLKGRSKEYIQGQIDGALKYIKYVEEITRNEFEEILFAVLYNRKPSGLIIFKNNSLNDKEDSYLDVVIYIESNQPVNNHLPLMFYRNHFYISFDEIFVELGLSNHFKQRELLHNDEIKSIEVIRNIVKSNRAKKLEICVKDSLVSKIDVSLNKPKNNKEQEEYKLKLGKNLDYKTKMYDGEINLFDFHYTINLK